MEIALQWKKLVLVGIAVAALAAYVVPSSELLGLNSATASIDQSIDQNQGGCSGDCDQDAGNYGSTSGGEQTLTKTLDKIKKAVKEHVAKLQPTKLM